MSVKDTSGNLGIARGVKSTTTRNPRMPNQLSQTPKNFSKDNYFLKEIQDKVDASWTLRPNRVDIEQEVTFGKDDYITYEVVAQSVKNDAGVIISDDWRRFVFRDIHYDCPIGTKFRVAPGYDVTVADKDKFIFLVFNKQNELTATNAVVVRRCNGTLGTPYLDKFGLVQYHYEPAVQQGISNTDFHYNKMATDPSAALTIVVQHNEFTKKYYINQRFIIGYDRVYRITNIDKFYSNNTYDPKNVGLITLYMAIDSIGERDDFVNRIAYNESNPVEHVHEKKIDNYHIIVREADAQYGFDTNNNSLVIPSNKPLAYIKINDSDYLEAYLYDGEDRQNNPISITYSIDKIPQSEWDKYVIIDNVDGHMFQIIRKKYCAHNLIINFYIDAADNPTGQRLETLLTVDLSGILPSDESEKVILAVGDVISIDGSEGLYRIVDRRGMNYELLDIAGDETSMFNIGSETIEFTNAMVGQKYADSLIDNLMSTYYNSLPIDMKEAIIPQNIFQDIWYYGDDGEPIYQGVYNNGTERLYQLSNALGTAEIGIRNCYALSIQEVLKYLGTTSDMSSDNTTLRYENIWKLFWFDQDVGTYQYPCLRTAYAKNSLRAFAVDGRNGSMNGISYDYTFLLRPAFVIDLSKVNYEKVQDSPLRSSDGYYFIAKD